ncbi:CU044_2847 family protein [Streptomyces sp. NPDC004752]|uniref:CU044_2847 family protein n=1 Tax=Streptomyces sp. AC550_RSS872 TaxID=2823689 RepID=UPI0027E54262|nr:CU044_2847 family protein [Streptomyces sp. AC550_RSS872]
MSELVRFEGPEGSELVVEVADDTPGLELISRREDGIVEARRRLRESLESTLPTLRSVVDTALALAPQEMEIDFGMKFTAEAGAVVAKTAAEGHLAVRLRWTRPESAPAQPTSPGN